MAKAILYLMMVALILFVGYQIFIALNSIIGAYSNTLNSAINSIN